MFCYQCEQAAGGKGCTVRGVCGKSGEAAALQDLLLVVTQGISQYTHAAAELGAERDGAVDAFVAEALFATVTNVNFDPERLAGLIEQAVELREKARGAYQAKAAAAGRAATDLPGPASISVTVDDGQEAMVVQGRAASLTKRLSRHGPDVTGLQELVIYGLKGMAAYVDHARILGVEDAEVYDFIHATLAHLASDPSDVAELTALALKVGEVNLKVMGMLDAANTGAYGHPVPTAARITPRRGKAILVSGHDLKDLDLLLQQTAGQDINVYTHGEMLPALAYPGLRRHPHLVGHYGGAWQDQHREFAAFPGPILMTTNCLQKPDPSYADRLFTTGLVAWPGTSHIAAGADGHKDFGPVIAAARAAAGFAADAPEKTITIGFARDAALGAAEQIIAAVKGGKIRHFFLIGGCDGAKPGRNYYTELAEKVPADCVILTLACGKFRFNRLELGEIDGIPRLLDVGQCNDAFSAIQIAVALAEAFGCGVNDLPLSLILSWYEQKAVAILLTLLHLGIKDIRLGPSVPAFVGPEVAKALQDGFGLQPVSTADADLAAILG